MSNGRVSFRLPRIYEHAQGKVRTEFGKGYWWEKVLGIQGWESDYESVRRTLQYLKERKIASEGSRRSYGTYFGRFCSEYGITNPDELNQKDPAGISKLIENFLADNVNWSAHYKNTIRAYLLLHFKRNGFTNNRSLLVEYERVQRRSRINPEYIPSRGEIWAMADGVGDTYNMALISSCTTQDSVRALFALSNTAISRTNTSRSEIPCLFRSFLE